MRLQFILLIVLFIPMAYFAQENIAINDLLSEAESKLYNHPEQTENIASYIISQKESTSIEAQATLLLAKSFYVRGNYNNAVKNAMNAKKLAYRTKEVDIKFETNFFALKLFRNLGLEPVSNNYLDELISLKKELQDQDMILWIEGKLKKDSAFVLFQNGNYTQASRALKKAELTFSIANDSLAKNEIDFALLEILMQKGQLDSVDIYLRKLHKQIHTDFEKLQFLDIEGRLHFNRKAYQKAESTFLQALALSISLPDKNHENISLERLALNYLALEDTKNFFSYKQQSNLVSTQIETDKNLAINSVYNFINSYQEELTETKIQQSYSYIYILISVLFILFTTGLIVNYLYASKTKEYLAIYKYISPKEVSIITSTKEKKLEKSSIVPEDTEQLLLKKLNKFESGKKYTNPDMSIALLASQFDTNTKYLSEVINRQKGKNFNTYINELRINYIIDKLKTDSVYFNYKVSYLAEESGFSSHSSFATVFKSVTGISPTKFMNLLQQRQETS